MGRVGDMATGSDALLSALARGMALLLHHYQAGRRSRDMEVDEIIDQLEAEKPSEQEATIRVLKARLPYWADVLEATHGVWLVLGDRECDMRQEFKNAIAEMRKTAEEL